MRQDSLKGLISGESPLGKALLGHKVGDLSLIHIYQAQAETVPMIYRVLIIAAVSMPFFWGASSVLPSVMRSAGDASYASYFSLVTMWVCLLYTSLRSARRSLAKCRWKS